MNSFDGLVAGFNKTMETWRFQLEKYRDEELCAQPGVESWSIGQVVLHIIEETTWYFDQISTCLKSDENSEKGTSSQIQQWFAQNSFPNKQFKGPPGLPTPPQPASKEALLAQFDDLAAKVRAVCKEIALRESKGRAEHPGHGFLNAREWFQYAEMHMRHHARQKDRIDACLSS